MAHFELTHNSILLKTFSSRYVEAANRINHGGNENTDMVLLFNEYSSDNFEL